MEGILFKWTNYWNGWQPRWFILEDGVLSYYQSRQDVSKGCKGSLKVSACDICVHSGDRTRLDLVIPAEQHFYLRAGSAKERQQWLLALGCAKQAETSTLNLNGGDDVVCLRTKRSELRLYCDLLMQQTHQLRSAVTGEQVALSQESSQPQADIGELSSMLAATCNTFIHTLDECMLLVSDLTSVTPQPAVVTQVSADGGVLAPSAVPSLGSSRLASKRSSSSS